MTERGWYRHSLNLLYIGGGSSVSFRSTSQEIKLKTITLVCAVAFAANIVMGLYNLSQYVSRMSGGMRLPPMYVTSQGVWIGAQCALVAFFVVLYTRQK